MANKDIRMALIETGVKQWELADALGVQDTSLSRKLRHKLPAEDKARILEAIRSVADGKGTDRND